MRITERLARVERFHGRVGLTIGNFEGFHRGHQEIIGRLVSECRRDDLFPAVITFKQHPLALLAGREPARLWSPTDKIVRLRDEGIALLVYIEFTPEFAGMDPRKFLRTLEETLGPRLICLGRNFRFGRNNEGDTLLLKESERRYGYRLVTVEDLRYHGSPVSSTRIREAVKRGNFELVSALLGRMYSVRLEPGSGRGELLPLTGNCAVPFRGLYEGLLEEFPPPREPEKAVPGAGFTAMMRIEGGRFVPQGGFMPDPERSYRFFFGKSLSK